MIPAFDEDGLLPPGIHDCTLADAKARFGNFQSSDRRPHLWARFVDFVKEAKASGVVELILVDGSFVTATASPNDLDLVIVLFATHDFGADLGPLQYNVLAQPQVRRHYGCDIIVVANGTDNLVDAAEFFMQVKQAPGRKKGLLRLKS